ncbi:PI-PLC X domain-containing protein 2 isoform X3 [Vicugna pacos]|uniref:PI-PLC X domain-containing protein 2 isoform X3 n=1 Tax=Vicugna pacos TaxID=30538 RepID=A0ABM5DKX5_VICPA
MPTGWPRSLLTSTTSPFPIWQSQENSIYRSIKRKYCVQKHKILSWNLNACPSTAEVDSAVPHLLCQHLREDSPCTTGSHDSFSYWVDEKSPVGPDQTPAVKRLARISLVKKLMKKWSVTQNLSFREQLEAGIRYFDLRVSSKPGDADQEIFFIHGLFGIRVWDGLMEIDSFLTQHPREIVFLDFNHFYAMDEAHHKHLILRIQEAFGNKLCSACSVESMKLQTLWEKKCQVLIFYHCPFYKQYPFLWPGKKIPAPWANTTSIKYLPCFLLQKHSQGSSLTQARCRPGPPPLNRTTRLRTRSDLCLAVDPAGFLAPPATPGTVCTCWGVQI